MTLTPAAMTLLGKVAWYLPKWLDKVLPNVDIEGEKLLASLEKAHAGTASRPAGHSSDDVRAPVPAMVNASSANAASGEAAPVDAGSSVAASAGAVSSNGGAHSVHGAHSAEQDHNGGRRVIEQAVSNAPSTGGGRHRS
jgi:hypothetical protein